MRFAKLICLGVLAAALAAYALDCGAAAPEQAMQCCQSKPCSSPGHSSRDCCKTMAAMHAPFVLAAPLHAPGISFAMVAFPKQSESLGSQSEAGYFFASYHSPPDTHSLSSRPLRI